MLNLSIAMARVIIILLIYSSLLLAGTNQAQTAVPGIDVISPLPGAALQGSVVISGSTDLAGFQTAEVAFSYEDTGPANWFLIQQSQDPVKTGTLAVWDTSKIADGNYRLRVQVTFQDGQVLEKTISGLRVRNYTVIETNTPTLTIEPQVSVSAVTPAATLTPVVLTGTPIPTPTILPPNPAQVQPGGLLFNIIMGVSFIIALFVLLGAYLWFKGRGR